MRPPGVGDLQDVGRSRFRAQDSDRGRRHTSDLKPASVGAEVSLRRYGRGQAQRGALGPPNGRFDDLVATVTRAHSEMRSLMDAVARLAWASGGITNARHQASQLCALFERHSQTAEFKLYRAFDALPDRVVHAQLVERLETSEPPHGP